MLEEILKTTKQTSIDFPFLIFFFCLIIYFDGELKDFFYFRQKSYSTLNLFTRPSPEKYFRGGFAVENLILVLV